MAEKPMTLREVATAASHALRSYQHGNASPELAESMANSLDAVLARMAPETARPAAATDAPYASAAIKHMVNRFLGWRLPENFSPDGGVSFKATFNENTAHEGRHQPSGTNLLDAIQAEAMVRHMLDGLTDAGKAADWELADYAKTVGNLRSALAICQQSLKEQAMARADPTMPRLALDVIERLRADSEAAYALAGDRDARVAAHGLSLLCDWQEAARATAAA